MSDLDLNGIYQVAVQDLIAEKTDSDKFFHAAFEGASEAHLRADNGKVILFTRCYELTMTYLSALRDIDEKYYGRTQNDFSNDRRQELKGYAEEIKKAGAMMFDGMVKSGMYFNQPNMYAFYDFLNAFYNKKPYDALSVSKQLRQDVNDAQTVFALTDQEKFTSPRLGEACFKFANANEFSKMVRLALQVDNENIYQYGKFIAGIEESVNNARQQYAVDSATIDRGFTTEQAFALDSSKNRTRNVKIRDNQAESIGRCALHTPGQYNKIAQETNHVGVGKLKICSVTQQRTCGMNPKHENWMDFLRGFYASGAAGVQVLKDMKTVLSFALNQGDVLENKKDMEELIEKFNTALQEKMPQTILGQHKESMELKDVTLSMLLLDAKLENRDITKEELQERSMIQDAIEHAIKKAKSCAKEMMKERGIEAELTPEQQLVKERKENWDETKELIQEGADYGAELFDRMRFDNLRGAPRCYGDRGMANLKLVTHLMSHGEQEHSNNLLVYNEAVSYLHDTFDKRLFEKEMEEEHEEEYGDRIQ